MLSGKVIKHSEVKTVTGEGMPQHRSPFNRGNLHIEFTVRFPDDGFLPPPKLKVAQLYYQYLTSANIANTASV